MSLMLGGLSKVDGYGLDVAPAITISSDGSIAPNDLLRACGEAVMMSGLNVANMTLNETVNSPFFRHLENQRRLISNQCAECCWLSVCGGGLMPHRYSRTNEFENESIYCAGLKRIYTTVASHLIKSGLPPQRLYRALSLT